MTSSREVARRAGVPRYKTGKACTHGHVADRYTSTGICVTCAQSRRRTPEQLVKHSSYKSDRWRTDATYREKALARQKVWHTKNKDRVAARHRARRLQKYGLTSSDYEAMIVSQNGCCAICRRSIQDFSIDHSHDTNRVRGLLCDVCNNHLGIYEKKREAFDTYLGKSSVVVPIPSSVAVYGTYLQQFVRGMVYKLDKNSHKATPTRKDVHQIVALLLGEVGEFLEQVSIDRTDANSLRELHDVSNFAFLAYIGLKQSGVEEDGNA